MVIALFKFKRSVTWSSSHVKKLQLEFRSTHSINCMIVFEYILLRSPIDLLLLFLLFNERWKTVLLDELSVIRFWFSILTYQYMKLVLFTGSCKLKCIQTYAEQNIKQLPIIKFHFLVQLCCRSGSMLRAFACISTGSVSFVHYLINIWKDSFWWIEKLNILYN